MNKHDNLEGKNYSADLGTPTGSGGSASASLDSFKSTRKNRVSVMKLVQMGVLAAMATVLMHIDFPLPLMPGWLKFDFSEVPILLAAFSLGPIPAVVIELVKNMIHMPVSSTFFAGELANFTIGSALVFTAGILFRQMKNRAESSLGQSVGNNLKAAEKMESRILWKSMLFGTLAMTLAACILNYFVNIPIFLKVMNLNMDALVGSCKVVGNVLVKDKLSLIFWVFVPFNLIKGGVVSIITAMVYKGVKNVLHHKDGKKTL